jgi:hypothetical protein
VVAVVLAAADALAAAATAAVDMPPVVEGITVNHLTF